MKRWFDCFRKKPSRKPDPQQPDEPNNTGHEDDKELRIAEVIGHTDSSSGASTYPINGKKIREYDWNTDRHKATKYLVDTERTDMALKGFWRDGVGRQGVAQQVGKWNAEIIHMRHFNSIGNNPAHGFEILMLKEHQNTQAHEIGRMFCSMFYGEFQTKQRRDAGIYWLEEGDRGYWNLKYHDIYSPNANFIFLSEPFFAGYKHDEAMMFLEGDGPERWERFMFSFYVKVREKFNI